MEGTPVEDGSLILTALGAAIREHRLQAGLTQAELAQRAGIGRPHLNHIEGGRKNPTVVVLVHLARGLGVAPGDFCCRSLSARQRADGSARSRCVGPARRSRRDRDYRLHRRRSRMIATSSAAGAQFVAGRRCR